MKTEAIVHQDISEIVIEGNFDVVSIDAGDVTEHVLTGAEDDLKKVSVIEQNGKLVCTGTSPMGSVSIVQNNVSFGGRATSTVIINGQVVSGTMNSAKIEPLHLALKVPAGTGLKARFTNSGSISTTAALGDVDITVSGSFEGELGHTKSLNAEFSGSATLNAKDVQGRLSVQVSGSGHVRASGSFTSFRINISGTAGVILQGDVAKEARFDVSGAGFISHYGKIHGGIEKRCSGAGKISLREA